MIIDTSALVAVARGEEDAIRYAQAIAGAKAPRISAGNWLEAAIVIDAGRDPIGRRRFDDLVEGVEVAPVTVRQVEIARAAYRDFGKGSGHPAQLNFGDCFAYALARDTREPLLFKGDDFVHTDVRPALPAG